MPGIGFAQHADAYESAKPAARAFKLFIAVGFKPMADDLAGLPQN